MACAVCAWTMLADSDMSPVYTLPLVLCALVMCYLQVRQPLRNWGNLGKCQNIIQHSPEGGRYFGMAVNSEVSILVSSILPKIQQQLAVQSKPYSPSLNLVS